jgi:hypothetical protein
MMGGGPSVVSLKITGRELKIIKRRKEVRDELGFSKL